MMRYPGDKRAQSRLVCKEAHLEAYLQSCKDRMQVLAGIRVELNGEVPSPYLSAKIKMRKKRTVIRELTHQGAAYLGTKNVLRAVAEHFKLAFSEIEPEEEVDWETFAKGATLSDAEVERLAAEWLEAEVKEALESLPKGKFPGQDGLPTEFFVLHWELLKTHVMEFVQEFAATAKMPGSISTSGDERDGEFPENFVMWTKGLHTEAGTRIIVNGWLSDKVEMNRGVRQGCPLAPYLFLCAIEPLCRDVRRRRLGIEPEGKEPLSYVEYADDTSFLLSGEGQLREVVEVLNVFGKQSGMKVNCDKSVVVPLGRNRGTPALADVPYKWSKQDEPERLLGVWITPSGDARPSWGRAYERIKEELGRWESQYLTTTARVAVMSCYVLPVLMFQAQVYSPPDKVWEKIRTISHAFVSAGEAVEEKIFILWRAYLAYLPRKDGGLGQLNPKLCLDGLAVRRVGKLLQEPEGARRWLAEKAAGFPQGWATLHAHPSATKLWQAGSVRWKAAVKIFWKSPFAELPAPANRWEVEEELIGFKRRIMHRGGSPFGHQIGTAGLINLRIKDLLTDGPGGRRCVKAVELLTLELGSKEGAGMALKAYEAMPLERKAMVEEPASAEAQVATPGVVRYVLWGEPSGPPWAVKGIDGTQAIVSRFLLNDEGGLTVPGKPSKGCFEACRLQPLMVQDNKLVGPVGDPKTRLISGSGFFIGGGLVPLRKVRAILTKTTGCSWRQAEWEDVWGKKIDWKKAIETRDSICVPLKARDVRV
ncbi:unnamed protein product [Closterium sp. NIES-65]|nr:unnamed protein product [Closterium sp. NIES-65]